MQSFFFPRFLLGHKILIFLFYVIVGCYWFLQSKYSIDEVSVDKRRRIANTKMPPNTGTRTQTRQAFAVVNGSQDLPPTSGPPSNSGSDCSAIEFSKEDVETLLNEKLRIKNKFNYKVC